MARRKYFAPNTNKINNHLSESEQNKINNHLSESEQNKSKFTTGEEMNFDKFISLIEVGQTQCRVQRDSRGRVTSIGFYVYVGRVIGRDRNGGDARWCCIVFHWGDRTFHLYPLEKPNFNDPRVTVCNRIHKVKQ